MEPKRTGYKNHDSLKAQCPVGWNGYQKERPEIYAAPALKEICSVFQTAHSSNTALLLGLLIGTAFIFTVAVKDPFKEQTELSEPHASHIKVVELDQAPLRSEFNSAMGNRIIGDATEEKKSPQEEESLPPYHSIILQAADRHDIDPALICAVIMAESSYNPNAVSKSGARGLMQLMPKTARALGVKDSLNPEHNINGGAKYIRQLLDRFDGNVKLALAAYNAGSRYVKKYRGIPPFRETQNYVKKVMSYYEDYQKKMSTDNDEIA